MGTSYDAVVVGAGPNGLSAAITLARAGLAVLVLEANDTVGGGCRTAELTLPGFHHDICAAIHPMGVASPFFRELAPDLARHGLDWAESPLPLAHPLPGGSAALLHRSVEDTSRNLGVDGRSWGRLMAPFLREPQTLLGEILRPLRFPRHPWLMARFGLKALRSCQSLVDAHFSGEAARALFAGCAAHSFLPLTYAATGSFGLVLALTAHAAGWPCAKGGSQSIINALAAYLRELGGTIYTGIRVKELQELPASSIVLFDLTPRQIVKIAGPELPPRYVQQLVRFQYGPAAFKVDWALSGPIPWRNPECHLAATVHLGGAFEEIAKSERAAAEGRVCDRPFVLVAQQSLFDPGRAPAGRHTAWAYCHVPHASKTDMTGRVETQIERFAPGFRDLVLARHVISPADYERHNANFIGGDIGGGANTLAQFFFRPVPRWDPYSTPNPRLFICSSSTPPGGGVHGMCGFWAAQSALRRVALQKRITTT